jgi:hypothetical protein
MSDFPRAALIDELCEAVAAGATLLLTGRLGIGKSWLLRALAAELERRGRPPIHLDLLLAAASPERFAGTASIALRAALPEAPAPEGFESVLEALLQSPSPLLLDEPTEIRALSTFAGLRDIEERLGSALARRPAAVLATSFPTAATRLGRFETRAIPPLTLAELEPYAGEAAAGILAGSGGAPGHARSLLRRLGDGDDVVVEAWVAAMRPGAEMDLACRGAWETLLLRSRGYAMSKAVLEAVALEEGLNLTALVARLGRTPGAVRDYLGWLLDVDALRSEGKRYYFVDPLLRDWLRLNAGGRPPSAAALLSAAEARLGAALRLPAPASRHDSLMEID